MKYIIILSLITATLAFSRDAYPLTDGDKDFHRAIKKAFASKDKRMLAEVVFYPIKIKTKDGIVVIKNSDDFVLNYNKVITEKMASIIQNQDENGARKNWAGVMLGDGAIWFSLIKPEGCDDYIYRIIAFNPPD